MSLLTFLVASWILAAILFFVAQKPKSKTMRTILRIVAVLLLLLPFLVRYL
jgi:hypothetical protein